MDAEEGGDTQGSWTDITESDEAMSGVGGDIENGWAEAVESELEDTGKGHGKGKAKGHEEGKRSKEQTIWKHLIRMLRTFQTRQIGSNQ